MRAAKIQISSLANVNYQAWLYGQLNQDKLDYIRKGRELVKKMLNSVHVTCEIDGTERVLIISNWLIRQRASKQLNVHLEREESVREAVSRQSLVKNCNVMEELC